MSFCSSFSHSISPRTCIACHRIDFNSVIASSKASLGPWRTRIPGYPGLEIPRRESRDLIALRFVVDKRWWNQIRTTKAGVSSTGLLETDCSGAIASMADIVDAVGTCSRKDSTISSNRSSVEEDRPSRIEFNSFCRD